MTAKEFLEHDNTIWRKIDDSNLTKATLIEFAQAYHESEVKKLGLFSVVGRSEQLSCPRCRHTGIDTDKDGLNYCRSCSHYWRAT